MSEKTKPAFQEYKSDQNVRWCPGCGDHGILNSLQRTLAELEVPREKVAVVSGIGCSSRLPYYMSTYGFHTIHGRASAVASGVKVANPELQVWQITGDGDALAIGGNHFIHAIRRNVDINVVLFNNQIYGLTKGQYSPTSKRGFISKTSPYGTIEYPFRPGELTIGSRGYFFARTIDKDVKLTVKAMKAAAKHQGTSIVEVLQNCVIYNDNTHYEITDKHHKEDRTLVLEHGKRMIFGKERNKGLVLDGTRLRVVEIGKGGITEKDILVHDAHCEDPTIHLKLADMEYPDYPVALGVIRDAEAPVYDQCLYQQIDEIRERSNIKSFKDLVTSGETWKVE